jgi:hypothetical protein
MVEIKTISLPLELVHVLKHIADDNRRSFSAEIRMRIEFSLTPEEILGCTGKLGK